MSTLADINKEFLQLKNELQLALLNVKALENEHALLKTDRDNLLHDYEIECDDNSSLRSHINELESTIDYLNRKVGNLQRERDDLQYDLDDKDNRIRNLESEISNKEYNINSLENDIRNLEYQLSNARNNYY